jgi:hypothetical protein
MTPPPMTTTRARAGSSGATGALSQTAHPDSSADPCHFLRWESQTNRCSEADAPGDGSLVAFTTDSRTISDQDPEDPIEGLPQEDLFGVELP